MSFRALTALGLLILAMAMERCGYYAVRSFLMVDLTRGGMTTTAAATLVGVMTLVAYAGTFAGGGLAVWLGPRVTAIIGAGIATLGTFAIAAGASIATMAFVIAIGAAIFKPCPYAAAAQILAEEDGGFRPSARRFASFATFVVLAYAAINLGSLIAPMMIGVLRDTRNTSSAYGFAGAVDLLATVLAVIAMVLGTNKAKEMAQQAHAPYRAPQGAPVETPPGAPATNDAVWTPLTLLGLVFVFIHVIVDRATPDMIGLGVARASWLFTINPVTVLVLTVPSAALYFVLAVQRSPLPLAKILGVGLLVFGMGGALAMLASLTHATVATWALALGIMAIGEAIVFPIGIVYAALAIRGRMATMVVAGWLALTAIPTFMMGSWLTRERGAILPTGLALIGIVVVFVGGVLVLVNADRLHRGLGGHSNATS